MKELLLFIFCSFFILSNNLNAKEKLAKEIGTIIESNEYYIDIVTRPYGTTNAFKITFDVTSYEHPIPTSIATEHCFKFDKFAFVYRVTHFKKDDSGNYYTRYSCFKNPGNKKNSIIKFNGKIINLPYSNIDWTNWTALEEKQLVALKEKEKKNKDDQENKVKMEKDKVDNQISTCTKYGFKKGTKAFMECINDLNNLEIEIAKLKNEELYFELKIEEAKSKNEAELVNELKIQSLISQQNQLLEIQNFSDGMSLLMDGLESIGGYNKPQNTPVITCQQIGNFTNCY